MARPTDADLVAYLDGELRADQRGWMTAWLARDHELQNRLLLLQSGGRPFRQAFETPLEEAPRGRLAAMLAALPSQRPVEIGRRQTSWAWLRPGLLATGVVLFAAGASLDHMLPQLSNALGMMGESEDDDDWRQTAAEYVALYTSDTVMGVPQDAALTERQLAMLNNKLGISLSLAGFLAERRA
jgi:anti-sigma factor RsiW